MDVCQNDGNLVALGGEDMIIKIFDKRVSSRFVRTFNGIHTGR